MVAAVEQAGAGQGVLAVEQREEPVVAPQRAQLAALVRLAAQRQALLMQGRQAAASIRTLAVSGPAVTPPIARTPLIIRIEIHSADSPFLSFWPHSAIGWSSGQPARRPEPVPAHRQERRWDSSTFLCRTLANAWMAASGQAAPP